MLTRMAETVERIRREVAGWPRWRRYFIFIMVPLVLLSCGALSVLPGLWLARLSAGEGAQSPDSAVSIYLTALSYDLEEGLTNVLAADRQPLLLAQWHRYRLAMTQSKPKPDRLVWSTLDVVNSSPGRAHVSTAVIAAWELDESLPKTWQFETRQAENGWVILLAQAPRWCGDYATPPACQQP